MKMLEQYGCEDVDRRGFVSLMDLYEINYIRFKKLVGDMSSMGVGGVSTVYGCKDLHLFIEECGRFTTDIRLSYVFEDAQTISFEPNLRCRIYHDAEVIEVVAGHLKHGKQRLDLIPAASLRVKWKMNRFLYKWLGYCLYLGHSFQENDDSDVEYSLRDKLSKQTA